MPPASAGGGNKPVSVAGVSPPLRNTLSCTMLHWSIVTHAENRNGLLKATRRMSVFCKYCGEQIIHTSKWCGHCGREVPPINRYRKAVPRTEVPDNKANPVNFPGKNAENRDAEPGSAGDLKSFMENTVAVNGAKPLYDGDVTQMSGPGFYGDATQTGGPDYQRDMGGGMTAEMDLDQTERNFIDRRNHGKEGGSSYPFPVDGTENTQNPAASFNRSGDLVGYPGEEDIHSGNEKGKKKPGGRKSSRKKARIIAGIASGFLIAGVAGFSLGRIFSRPSPMESSALTESVEESWTSEQEATPVPGSEIPQGGASEESGSESPYEPSHPQGDGEQPDDNDGQQSGDKEPGTVSGGDYSIRDVVSQEIADTEDRPAETDYVPDDEVNGPKIQGDIPVIS